MTESQPSIQPTNDQAVQNVPGPAKENTKRELSEQEKKAKREKMKRYVRVGDEYFEKITKPDKYGQPFTELDRRKRSTIVDDNGREALRYVRKFKAFCLVPSHTQFRESISNCYNTYHPLTWSPAPGPIAHTMQMLEHIFGERVAVALDYLQLLYLKPTQNLPILCLLSEERNTGKSTFGQWLVDVFGQNAAKLGNADIASEFNTTYAEKLLIVVDETAIEKRVVSEAIKRMSTEKGRIYVNPKGQQQYAVEFIGKFIFISNDEEKFMYVGKGENRFFVIKVPVLTKDELDMESKLKAEIPAFLHFLAGRQLVHKRESRLYFHFDLYRTEQLDRVINANVSKTEALIRELVTDTFYMFPDAVELMYSLTDLFEELKDDARWLDKNTIRTILTRDMRYQPEKQQRYQYCSLKASQTSEIGPVSYERNGKPYLFKIQDFLPGVEFELRRAAEAFSDHFGPVERSKALF